MTEQDRLQKSLLIFRANQAIKDTAETIHLASSQYISPIDSKSSPELVKVTGERTHKLLESLANILNDISPAEAEKLSSILNECRQTFPINPSTPSS